MSATTRNVHYCLPVGTAADWVILDRKDGVAHVYSKSLDTDSYCAFNELVVAVRNEDTQSLFPAAGTPEPSTGLSVRPDCSPGTGGQPLPSTIAANRVRVLLAHNAASGRGLTGWELEQALQTPYEVVGPRRPSLEADGLIVDTGLKRPNNRGNLQRVYRITDAGRVVAERASA